MEKLLAAFIPLGTLTAWYQQGHAWLFGTVLVTSTLIQLAVVLSAFLLARLTTSPIRRLLLASSRKDGVEPRLQRVLRALAPLALPVVWLIMQWTSVGVARHLGWPHHLITVTVSLLTAWVIIRTTANVVQDPAWARFISRVAWVIAALNILNLLDEAIALLDRLAITVGEVHLSALTVLRALLYLGLALWGAAALARLAEKWLGGIGSMTPSLKVLLGKLLRIVFLMVAVVTALSAVGIDLTAFAVFTGALGVGIGFGLQKIVSNLISGIILLIDRSIKPGDVIALAQNQTYGWVKTLGARYTSVITRDGIEHLIPNEELITQRVENWSFSHNLVRVKLPIGVSYDSDVDQVMALCISAVADVPRVLRDPPPVCYLLNFGASSLDFQLRFWISDPQNGMGNVRHQVLLNVWRLFQEHGIEIPYPQQDLHIRSSAELPLRLATGGVTPGEPPAAASAPPRPAAAPDAGPTDW